MAIDVSPAGVSSPQGRLDVASVSSLDVTAAEEGLRVLLSGLRSAYCYAVRRPSRGCAGGRLFEVEWSRRPSPHEPLPDVRVLMEVAVFLPSSPHRPALYRLEDELTVHPFAGMEGVGVDGALLRVMKMKAEFYRRHSSGGSGTGLASAGQSATEFIASRCRYQPYAPPQLFPSKGEREASDVAFAFSRPPLPFSGQWQALTEALRPPQSKVTKAQAAAVLPPVRRRPGWSWREDNEEAEAEPSPAVPNSSAPLPSLAPAPLSPPPSASSAAALPAVALPTSAAAAAPNAATPVSAIKRSSRSNGSTSSSPSFLPSSPPSSSAPSTPYSLIPTAAVLEVRLVELFRQADVDGSGRLSVDEVALLLSGSELGLNVSSSSLHSFVSALMTATDENGDGQLVWAEFLPVAVDLVQTASAAKVAREALRLQREELRASIERRMGGRTHPDLAAELTASAQAMDPNNTGLLHPAAFQRLAQAAIAQGLTELEMSLLLDQMEKNGAGDVVYAPLVEHTATFLNHIMEAAAWQMARDPLEAELLSLCPPLNPSTPSAVLHCRPACRHSSHSPSSSPALSPSASLVLLSSGVLSHAQATALLKAVDVLGIRLSPTQLSCMLLDDTGCVCVEYEAESFLRRTSLQLQSLFASASVVERSTLSVRGVVAPIALLTAQDRERVEAELRQRFAEFDSNNDGLLDAVEFAQCLADTSLCLSAQQIEALRQEVDTNNSGTIQVEAFMHFAYAKLLHLAREARIQHGFVNLTSLQ